MKSHKKTQKRLEEFSSPLFCVFARLFVPRFLVAQVFVAFLLTACSREPRELVLSGPTMGTTYTVKVVGTPDDVDADAVRRAIDDVLANIDSEMSAYRSDSAISQFNAARSTAWIEVPVGLARVAAAAQAVSERSRGAFDITVAPLIQAWGFSASGEPGKLPTGEQIAALRERIGYGLLDVRLTPPALRKHHPELMIDVNGVAPGYAVDLLAERLHALGLQHFMIDIGGEVLVRGRNASGTPWRIAVERPQDTDPQPFTIIELEDRSVTTSGEYRHYFERDGRRYSHTIDPRTGHPIASHGSVAVVGATSLDIDAWATALNVLGPDAGLELANERGIAAMYVTVENGELKARKSSKFETDVRLFEAK
jgi:FAD:protein FMN transferase